MRVLIAPTENFIFGEKTFFEEAVEAGNTELSVESAHNFKENDFIILGAIGNETTEIKQISSISADLKTITISEETNFSHSKLTPVQATMFNKRKFYRSSEEEGTYTHLTTEGSPVDIEVDVPEGTRFEDSAGTGSSYYKATYYNDFTVTETSLDDAIAALASDAAFYTSIFKIKREAGLLENSYITGDLINGYRTEAEAQIDGMIANTYQLPLAGSKLIQHIATLLAAGHLLSKEYGMEADTEVAKSGQRKIERAEELLEKIVAGDILLIGENGNILDRRSTFFASGSNVYSDDRADRGVLFNLEPENFKLTDPDKPLSSSVRRKTEKKWTK
jgi:hypothetical protein